MVRDLDKRFKKSLILNTGSRNAVMMCCRGNYGNKMLFSVCF